MIEKWDYSTKWLPFQKLSMDILEIGAILHRLKLIINHRVNHQKIVQNHPNQNNQKPGEHGKVVWR